MTQNTKEDLPHITYLPPSVTSLADCMKYEIGIIEQRFQELLNEKGDIGDKDQEKQRLRGEMDLLEDALDDGFLCIDLQVLKRKLRIWHDLFSNNHYGISVTPYYAIKCNPDPWIVHFLANSSCRDSPIGYDCASMAELILAKQQLAMIFARNGGAEHDTDTHDTTVPDTRIVYANPQRAEADLMQALELFATTAAVEDGSSSDERAQQSYAPQDLWLTLDGIEEVSKIAKARDDFVDKQNENDNPLKIPRILLIIRIWVPDGHSQVPLGEKFGASLDTIPAIVQVCHKHSLLDSIGGVSFHCGSGCESVETYQEALTMAQTAIGMVEIECNQYKKEPHKCWLLDMGGGFPGVDGMGGDEGRFVGATFHAKNSNENSNVNLSNPNATPIGSATLAKTTVADIAEGIQPMLKSFVHDQQWTLIAEPGRYFVEGAAVLASRIYWKRLLSAEVSNDNASENSIRVYKIPHGVQGVFKDVILCNEVFVPQPLKIESANRDGKNSSELFLSKIIGPSGDPEDVVNQRCMLPELEVGDWLVFDRMGAYTTSIASKAGRPVMRYVCGGGASDQLGNNE
jgi:ornithine decarboxylase